jgi:imidazolonepropionase-like amidohydrolase/type 1 glutamine amidotransferase
LVLVLAASAVCMAADTGVQALVGAQLIDPAANGKTIDNAVVLIRDGKIERVGPASSVPVPAGARVTTLTGKFLLPGLISTHVHISDINGLAPRAYTDENTERQLGLFARYGITTVWSLGGEQEPAFRARARQNTSSLTHARLYLAGEIVTSKTPEEARQVVATQAARKVDVIKIRVDDNLGTTPKMTPEVYRAVIDEAHKRGLRVAAHIFYLDDAKDLLRSGVDIIAHSVRDKDIDEEFVRLMKARTVPYCPTLTRDLSTFVYESTPAFFADPFFAREADHAVVAQLQEPARQTAMQASRTAQGYKAALVVAKRNLKKAADAGLLIAMGTDTGASPERFQGYLEHLELQMMAEAGLSPAQILRASTIDAARALKQETAIGVLTPGAWADLAAYDRSPLQDIGNTRSLSGVWIAGNEVALSPLRVLVVTGGHGYPTSFYTLFEQPGFVWDHETTAEAAYRRDLRPRYDVVVMYDLVEKGLSAEARANLQAFAESGKGIVVLHHALCSNNDWDWYRDLVGGRYLIVPQGGMPTSTYKHEEAIPVAMGRPHPITRGITLTEVFDEVYKGMWISPDATVLLTTTHPLADPQLAWISPYQKSRVVTIQLGHGRETHVNPQYRALIRNAILWSGGRLQ